MEMSNACLISEFVYFQSYRRRTETAQKRTSVSASTQPRFEGAKRPSRLCFDSDSIDTSVTGVRGRRSRPRSLCFCLCDSEELILHIDCQKRPRPQRVRKPQKRPEFSTVRVCVCDIYCYWLCSIEQIRLNWCSVTKLLTSQSSFDFHSTQLKPETLKPNTHAH